MTGKISNSYLINRSHTAYLSEIILLIYIKAPSLIDIMSSETKSELDEATTGGADVADQGSLATLRMHRARTRPAIWRTAAFAGEFADCYIKVNVNL